MPEDGHDDRADDPTDDDATADPETSDPELRTASWDHETARYRKVSIDALEPQDWPGVDPRIVPVGYELQPQLMRPNVWEYDAGDEMPLHHQTEQEELFVVLEGVAELTIADRTVEISTGDVVWVPPEPWRGIVARTDCRILAIGAPNTSDDGVFHDES